jgi:hypothetical protein
VPKTVYLETTIFSALASSRTDAGSVYRKEITQEWWEKQRVNFELFSSQAVIDELQGGNYPGKETALEFVRDISLLDVSDEALNIANFFIEQRLMPEPATGDALHLAICCLNRIDYLLTWNIRHLANPNKIEHMQVLHRRVGLLPPEILNPDMLWLEE